MQIQPDTKCWIVVDPRSPSGLDDVCFEASFASLGLRFEGWLDAEQTPAIFTTMEEAREEARNRLLVWRSARQYRIEEGLPENEVVTVVLSDEHGRVLFEGEVQ